MITACSRRPSSPPRAARTTAVIATPLPPSTSPGPARAPAARSVTVTVTDDAGHVGVQITDDAPAAAARAGGGYGLVGMRERVEALGGKVAAGPLPGAGWAVRARLPVAAPGRA
jgi:hypothetical protein